MDKTCYETDFTAYEPRPSAFIQLHTEGNILKFIFLSFITFGIYYIIVFSNISKKINIIAQRYDDKKTADFRLIAFIAAPATFGIGFFVWHYKLTARIEQELKRRNIGYCFGRKDFWIWNVLGIMIIIGPLLYLYKLFTAMNFISEDFNENYKIYYSYVQNCKK